ncbi:MAG TPA: hypothetical protein VNK73_10555 [Actinomycetota bacterium]|nr:hypothetical protein [Actinomycetota bacterium]
MWEGLARLAEMPDWLALFDDPARVSAALRDAVPGLRSAKLSAVRLKQEAWAARCKLVLAGEDGADRVLYFSGTIVPPGQQAPPGTPPSAAGLADGGPGWLPALRLALVPEPQAETKLSALARLTDPAEARALLEQAIRAGTPTYRDLRILACEPRMMRYSPGSRATILYHLDLPAEGRAAGWPDVVVAKTYHRSDKGRTAWDGMQALWRSPLGRSGTVAIAEPLAWMPELKILVQGPIRQEQTLKDRLLETLAADDETGWAELRGYLAKAADGLVELHRSWVPSAEHVTWDDEHAEVREVLSRVTSRLPELAGAADEFLDEVERIAGRVPADPAGPAHRSFRPAQVLLHAGEIGFIDFDGFCQAEPALDVALFRATVRDVGMGTLPPHASPAARQARVAQVDALCDEFLGEYQARSPISPERVAVWEALDLLTNVLHAWTKAKPVRLEYGVALLRDHANRLGALTTAP